MGQPQQDSSELTALPAVDGHVLQVLQASHRFNPDGLRNWMRNTVEEDQRFAHQIVIEANRRSDGDMARQAAFVEGANFVREALRRTVAVNNVEGAETLELDDFFATIDGTKEVQPVLETTRKRLGFRNISAVVAVLSMFRHSGRRHPGTT